MCILKITTVKTKHRNPQNEFKIFIRTRLNLIILPLLYKKYFIKRLHILFSTHELNVYNIFFTIVIRFILKIVYKLRKNTII